MITLYYLNKSFIKLENQILYITIDLDYNNKSILTLLEYFKNIWILTIENNNKYYLSINIVNVSILNTNIIEQIVIILTELSSIFITNLHSTCLIINSEYLLNIIKPILNFYNTVRPFKICNNNTECLQFFKLNHL